MKQYAVSDGKVVLTLQDAEKGGYIVTSPLDLQLITKADTVKEAFENARALWLLFTLPGESSSNSWPA